VIEGKGSVMTHIRAQWRCILLVGYRGRPLNVIVDEVVAKRPAAYSRSCSFEDTDCLRVRSTEKEPGEGTGSSGEAL
jgi:hypothetical protein